MDRYVINTCCAYTDDYSILTKCPFCNKERYQTEFHQNQQCKPCRQFAHFPIIDRLRIQYQDATQAKALLYRAEYTSRCGYHTDGKIGDVFDGQHYKDLVKKGHFQEKQDIALMVSIDGFQIFKQKTDDCWVLLFINTNLPPEQRVKKENLLITTIIPGPKEPKDLNSFLFPAIAELQRLEGIFIIIIKICYY